MERDYYFYMNGRLLCLGIDKSGNNIYTKSLPINPKEEDIRIYFSGFSKYEINGNKINLIVNNAD